LGLPPVVILGMGRSGSSMLTKFLETLGLFVGHDKRGGNNEAWFFHCLNEWMLHCANSTWDNPHNFNFIDIELRSDLVRVARRQLRSVRRLNYLGWKNFFQFNDISDLKFPWGWKNPRNTFTLDVWKEIFPECKIIHIYRHPIDSAESARYGKEINKSRKKRNWKWDVKEYLLLKVDYQLSARTGNIYESLNLWEEYVAKSLSWNEHFGNNIRHIKYESLLEDPIKVMKDLLVFLNMHVNDDQLTSIVSTINPDRKYAFLRRPELVKIYEQIKNKEIVKRLGYDNLI